MILNPLYILEHCKCVFTQCNLQNLIFNPISLHSFDPFDVLFLFCILIQKQIRKFALQ